MVHALEGRHASVEEKARACQRLGEYGDESAVPVLASVLNDPVLNVYARAALERIPGPQSIAALRSALKTCDGPQLIGVIESWEPWAQRVQQRSDNVCWSCG